MSIALVGNPNSGKTTVFNALTGGRGHVGNWPGVTVDKKEGPVEINNEKHVLMDLPGIYSLDPDTAEQIIARNYLIQSDVELIINVIDSGALERSLILTLQLLKLNKPVILALNMTDELDARGEAIDTARLSVLLGVPAVPVSAARGKNLDVLTEKAGALLKAGPSHPVCKGCTGCKSCGMGLGQADISDVAPQVFVVSAKRSRDLTERIDRIVLNKWLSIPVFLLVMLAVFFLTFEAAGWLSGVISAFLNGTVSPSLTSWLKVIGTPAALVSLLGSGVISGVGTVLAFLPQIAALFFLTSLLEDSGYMARAAFIADRALAKIGLGGGSIMPLIMGFGCSVPAVMACRTLPSEKERKLASMLVPFFSCSARLPVYALLAGALFPKAQGIVILSIYLLGIAVAVAAGGILNKTLFHGSDSAFVMEIPPYRLPSARNLLLHSWERVKGFLTRAGTVLLVASVVIWALQYFTPSFQPAGDASQSLIAAIGRMIAPIFAPIGLGNWQSGVAFLTGIFSKEAIVSTLGVLTGGSGNVTAAMQTLLTPLQAYVFMVFSLLYIPCVSTIATLRKEMNSPKYTLYTILLGLGTAYAVCFIIYNVARII